MMAIQPLIYNPPPLETKPLSYNSTHNRAPFFTASTLEGNRTLCTDIRLWSLGWYGIHRLVNGVTGLTIQLCSSPHPYIVSLCLFCLSFIYLG